jgi:hypothetical protein
MELDAAEQEALEKERTMKPEQELDPRVVANLARLASAVMVEWYRGVRVAPEVVVDWSVPALLAAVWSEN